MLNIIQKFEHNGIPAEVHFDTLVFCENPPDYGTVELKSAICNYKSDLVGMDSESTIIGNIFLKWFQLKAEGNNKF